MSKMKMSEHFPEAFQVDHNNSFEVQDVTWYSYGEKYESNCDQDSAFGHAVLNHDRMVEEIADLKEALPVIKQMIFSMKTNAHTFSNENVEEVSREGRSAMRLIDKLLAKLNQEGEE